jgi:predicted nuclease of predicted toxin-antitoxin system
MRVLFDHSTPAPLRFRLKLHAVTEARELGWDKLANGDLLNSAEAEGFEVFVTADKNMGYQQNLTGRKIAIVVIGNAQWKMLRRYADRVVSAVDEAIPGSFVEVYVPFN